ADNGRLDGTYSKSQLQSEAKDPSVQGYGNVVVQALPPKPRAETKPAKAGPQPTVPRYCRNAQGQLLNASGHVVASPSQAAPAGAACKQAAPEVCRNSQGQPVDRFGNVVSNVSEA